MSEFEKRNYIRMLIRHNQKNRENIMYGAAEIADQVQDSFERVPSRRFIPRYLGFLS